MKHAAIFLCPATRGSFKTVYEDSDTEGGPILCQKVFHQLFKPSVESGDLKWVASLPLPYYGVFLDFFWGVDLISVGDTLVVAMYVCIYYKLLVI